MKILLFGGSGLLGKELQRALKAHTVLAPSHSDVDITDEATVERAINETAAQYIINAAACINVDALECDPELAEYINAKGAGILARAAAKHNLPLLHISTNYVFAHSNLPYKEDAKRLPSNVYGLTKSQGEDLVRAALSKARQYIVRTSWLYSPVRATYIDYVATMLAEGKVVEASTQIGNPTHAGELADAIVLHFIEGERQNGTYHLINTGEDATRYAIAREVARTLGVPEERVVSKEYSSSSLRPSVMLINTKLPPLPSWRESLRMYIETRYKKGS